MYKRQGKRREIVSEYKFDTKYASHAVRLADECEQILEFGDLDLRRSRDFQKNIRSGLVPLDDIKKWLFEKERTLSGLYETSSLPDRPNKARIKQLLFDCLEQYYGNLSGAEVVQVDRNATILDQIKELVN